MNRQMSKKVVCVSGGFDPIHIGHLRMMREASRHGDVVAIVNSDKWLMRKKGYIFMPFKERCEILEGLECVTRTTSVEDSDNTVCEALQRIRPDYFANGGDRKTDNTPEMDICEQIGTQMLWAIGGGKIQSSSTLVNDSGMVRKTVTNIDGVDITPTRVEVLTAGDIAKNGDY